MKAIMVFLLFILLINYSLAEEHLQPLIDIYKTKQISSEKIQIKYEKQFKKISDILLSSESMTSEKNSKEVGALITEIVSGIYAMGDFSSVNLSPILYPN